MRFIVHLVGHGLPRGVGPPVEPAGFVRRGGAHVARGPADAQPQVDGLGRRSAACARTFPAPAAGSGRLRLVAGTGGEARETKKHG